MCRVIFPENNVVYHDVNFDVERGGNSVNPLLFVNGSVNVQGNSKGTPDMTDFFAKLDDMYIRMLMMINELRDTLQFINQKKQALGWGLEVNALQQNVKAINDSFYATVGAAVGGICAGALMAAGAAAGVAAGEVWMMAGNAAGQMVNGIGTLVSGSKTREADQEKAIAGLLNQGAQSYAKTQDDSLMKGNEIKKQGIEGYRNLVEQEGQMLRALFHY